MPNPICGLANDVGLWVGSNEWEGVYGIAKIVSRSVKAEVRANEGMRPVVVRLPVASAQIRRSHVSPPGQRTISSGLRNRLSAGLVSSLPFCSETSTAFCHSGSLLNAFQLATAC